ncbi:MAG TPA: glycosyltransferase [Gemmatales bacterium]|nr:glycosyltransferase [Gemmatales bacterium]
MRLAAILPEGGASLTSLQRVLLGRGLATQGHGLVVLQLAGRPDPALVAADLEVIPLGGRTAEDPLALYRCWQWLRQERFDALLCLAPPGPVLSRALRLMAGGQPLLVWANEPPSGRRWLQAPGDLWLAPNNALAQLWLEWGIKRGRLRVIPPAAPLITARDTGLSLRPELGVPASARLVLVAEPLQPGNAVKQALWSLNILNYLHDELYLVVVGDGPERARLHEFAQDIQALSHVRFLRGARPLAEIVPEIDLVWAAGISPVVPDAVLAAAAAGKPALATFGSCQGQAVLHGETGFILPPQDPAVWARQTHQLLCEPALLERLGRAAQAHVRYHFRAASLVQAHIHAVAELRRPALAA